MDSTFPGLRHKLAGPPPCAAGAGKSRRACQIPALGFDDERLCGLLALRDVTAFFSLKLELEHAHSA